MPITTGEAQPRRFRPYSAYAPTDVSWVQQLPSHWQTKPLKFAVRINPDELPETTDPDYEIGYVDIGNVEHIRGILCTQEYRFEDAPSRARRRVCDGDTIISTVRTYLKAVARIEKPPENMIVSTGFAVLRPGRDVHPGYLYRLVQCEEFVGRVVANSVGVSYPAIAPTVLGRCAIWLPPFDEQRAIAAFLDRETAKIDGLVEKKRRLVELLKEKRTALISRAVTKGLNPVAPMKPSGVEWFGDVPEAWTVKRLRHIVLNITVGIVVTPAKYYELEGVPCLRSLNISSQRIADLAELVYISTDANRLHRKSIIRAGDIVIVRTGRTGAAAIVTPEFDGANCVDLVIVRQSEQVYPEYLHYYINALPATRQVEAMSVGSLQAHYNTRTVGELVVPVPPKDEQRRILDYLETATGRLERLSGQVSGAIERLNEYRSALISAAVTGKIDVRGEVVACR